MAKRNTPRGQVEHGARHRQGTVWLAGRAAAVPSAERRIVGSAKRTWAAAPKPECATNGSRLPLIANDALAGIAARDVGELALERRGGGPAVQPFVFHRGGNQRGIGGLCCSVDHPRSARRRRAAELSSDRDLSGCRQVQMIQIGPEVFPRMAIERLRNWSASAERP
jgi:hypothetical protein